MSVSIALTENHDTNGGLMIMPGSHRTFLGCAGETPKDNYKKSLQMQDAGTPSDEALTALADRHGIKLFTGRAGSATWFDCNCMHGSGDNITPYPAQQRLHRVQQRGERGGGAVRGAGAAARTSSVRGTSPRCADRTTRALIAARHEGGAGPMGPAPPSVPCRRQFALSAG